MRWLAVVPTLTFLAVGIVLFNNNRSAELCVATKPIGTALVPEHLNKRSSLETSFQKLSDALDENNQQWEALNVTLDRLNKRLSKGPKQ